MLSNPIKLPLYNGQIKSFIMDITWFRPLFRNNLYILNSNKLIFFSIVEDGIMVQVSQERMMQIRKSLNQMEDCQIDCGPIGAEKPDETVYLRWVDNDLSVNAG
jgi:hypothetical protein